MAASELSLRIRTAVIMTVPLILLLVSGLVYPEARTLLMGLGYLIVGIAALEFAKVCSANGDKLRTVVYFICMIMTPTAALFDSYKYVDNGGGFGLLTATSLLYSLYLSFLLAVLYIFVVGREASMVPRLIAQDIFVGIFLVGLGGGSLVLLPAGVAGIKLVAWLLLVVIANDVGAYFSGKAIGGPKLASYLSPNKTVSGSLGGLVSGIIIGSVFTFLLCSSGGFWLQIFGLALMVGIACQAGDLIKSYVKRLHGVKDMGEILPGHGGILDRIDGLLCAAPVLYFTWIMINF